MTDAQEATLGYGLDGGGYSFESVEGEHPLAGTVSWDNPDWDYFPGWEPEMSDRPGQWGHEVYFDVGIFARDEWPRTFRTGNDEPGRRVMHKVGEGSLGESERECDCHGHTEDECDGDCDQRDSAWHYTGDTSDEPFEHCEKCEGGGYLTCPGGTYAVYAFLLPPRGWSGEG